MDEDFLCLAVSNVLGAWKVAFWAQWAKVYWSRPGILYFMWFDFVQHTMSQVSRLMYPVRTQYPAHSSQHART